MEQHNVNVVLKPSHTSMLDLPSSLAQQLFSLNVLPQQVVVKVSYTPMSTGSRVKTETYIGWSGLTTNSDTETSIDPAVASSLHIPVNAVVSLFVELHPPVVKTAEVDPLTADDWETVQLHASAMEFLITQQTRALCLNSVLTFFVPGSNVRAQLRVTKLELEEGKQGKWGLLGNMAEISVAPKSRRPPAAAAAACTAKRASSQSRANEKPVMVLKRGVSLPYPMLESVHDGKAFEVFVNPRDLPVALRTVKYVQVSIVPGPKPPSNNANSNPQQQQQQAQSEEELPFSKKIIAKLTSCTKLQSHDQVCLSRLLTVALSIPSDLKAGYVVKLQTLAKSTAKQTQTRVAVLKVQRFITQTESSISSKRKETVEAKKLKLSLMKEKLSEWFGIYGLGNVAITSQTKLPSFEEGIDELFPSGFLLKINTDQGYYHLPAEDEDGNVREMKFKFEIGEDLLIPQSQAPEAYHSTTKKESKVKEEAIGQDELIGKIIKHITTPSSTSKGILLHGASGSGKTLVIDTITARLSSASATAYHIVNFDCSSLSKLSFAQIKEKLTYLITQALWFAPTVLVLESLESVFPAESEQGDSTATRQVVEWFVSYVKSLIHGGKKAVVLLGSAKSKEVLNPLLTSSHLFSESHGLKAPSKESRELILSSSLKKCGVTIDKAFDLSKLSLETEGYVAKDLKVLAERIQHEVIYRSIMLSVNDTATDSLLLSNEIFDTAIKDFTPSSLRGVKLQKSTTSWSDIGGLRQAKLTLLETLEWPTKYAPIFKSATLRLRSGILLYGYPGCGKTLLASAIASQCGLNFISVKGPEILNKYIGASEASVRDLFERASAAKPCILFFDEFDSIAPKRGHDSTGVTDRVVNQMLTQMDGAEGLDGVYVLAATSRPDLIDSALLRPGRLDKAVVCDLPDYEDRLDILTSVTRKMHFNQGVDLKEVAVACGGFSGADLQAVATNAYLKAVNKKLEMEAKEAEEGKVNNEGDGETVHEFFKLNLKDHHTKMATGSGGGLKPSERNQISQQIKLLLASFSSGATDSTASEDKKKGNKAPVIHITHQDFLASLAETKPSISQSEKLKLGAIYDKFSENDRGADMKDGSGAGTAETGVRSTLA